MKKPSHVVTGYIIRDMLNITVEQYRELYINTLVDFLHSVGLQDDVELLLKETQFMEWFKQEWTQREAERLPKFKRDGTTVLYQYEADQAMKLKDDEAKWWFFRSIHFVPVFKHNWEFQMRFKEVLKQVTICSK